MDDFCMTYSGHEGLFYAGYCPFSYRFNHTNRLFSLLTPDPDLLNHTMCGPYNRKGLLCGQCIDGYGPGVTVNDKCVDCSKFSTGSAICLYLLVEFVPVSIFFFLVTIFRLNLTAGPMMGYLLFCQGLSFFIKIFQPTENMSVAESVFQGIFEFWSLNLLTPLIPPFCISDKLTELHITLLDSVSTICLVFLVIIYITAIDLHSRGCKAISLFTKPFSALCKRLNCSREVTSNSVIHTFSTFLFLSSTKTFKTFYVLCQATSVFSNTDGLTKKVVFADTSVQYFSLTHILFFVVAFVQCLVLVFFPLLLLVIYPTRIYRYLSRFISTRKQLAITAFVEALNGPFKDGLNGTTDYRPLAGVVLFGIPLLTVLWITMANATSVFSTNTSFFLLASLFVSYSRLFKSTIANMSLSFYFILFWAFQWTLYIWVNDLNTSTATLRLMFTLILLTSQLPVSAWALYHLTRYILKKISERDRMP